MTNDQLIAHLTKILEQTFADGFEQKQYMLP